MKARLRLKLRRVRGGEYNMGEITSVVTQVFGDLFVAVLRGLPQFFAGLVILLVGLISASILMRAVQGVLGLLMIEKWAEKR